MATRMMVGLIVALMAVIGGYGIWYHQVHPREIVRTGSVAIDALTSGHAEALVTARTRVVRVGAVILNEVELPGGTWIDCARNCASAYRESTNAFWDSLSRNGR